VKPLPDWLVERAALDEVPAASADRIARADSRELAERIAALRDDTAAELARHPAGPAVIQIEARIAADARRRAEARRRRRLRWLGVATSAAAAVVVAHVVVDRGAPDEPAHSRAVALEDGRVKGPARLLAFRQLGGPTGAATGDQGAQGVQIERLEQDAVVRAGDVIQLRYNAGGRGYGMIASLDGAGVVTLHYPLSEDAPPEATAVASDTTALPTAYALDDAPGFERFFFLTANAPLDVHQALAALRALARRGDSATGSLDLPAGVRQSSLRLRKPDPANHELP
jgi:hypothetical protein